MCALNSDIPDEHMEVVRDVKQRGGMGTTDQHDAMHAYVYDGSDAGSSL